MQGVAVLALWVLLGWRRGKNRALRSKVVIGPRRLLSVGAVQIFNRDFEPDPLSVVDAFCEYVALGILVSGRKDFHNEHRQVGKFLCRDKLRIGLRSKIDVMEYLFLGSRSLPRGHRR